MARRSQPQTLASPSSRGSSRAREARPCLSRCNTGWKAPLVAFAPRASISSRINTLTRCPRRCTHRHHACRPVQPRDEGSGGRGRSGPNERPRLRRPLRERVRRRIQRVRDRARFRPALRRTRRRRHSHADYHEPSVRTRAARDAARDAGPVRGALRRHFSSRRPHPATRASRRSWSTRRERGHHNGRFRNSKARIVRSAARPVVPHACR